MLERLGANDVSTVCKAEISKVTKKSAGLEVTIAHENEVWTEGFDHVFNCTYSRLNFLNEKSALPLVPLKHELTEMCLVKMPATLQRMGFTVMCGPFFSVMPFPSVLHDEGFAHSLSHVRYTPHYEWQDQPGNKYVDALRRLSEDKRHTAFPYMLKV